MSREHAPSTAGGATDAPAHSHSQPAQPAQPGLSQTPLPIRTTDACEKPVNSSPETQGQEETRGPGPTAPSTLQPGAAVPDPGTGSGPRPPGAQRRPSRRPLGTGRGALAAAGGSSPQDEHGGILFELVENLKWKTHTE